MIGEKKAWEVFQKLLLIIENYVQIAAIPKRYGTKTFYHRLEIHLVDTIGKNEGINVTELSKAHKISKSAVSQAVRKLEKKALVERYHKKDNRKEVLFRITREGRKAYDGHLAFHAKVEKPYIAELAHFSEKETAAVVKFLDLLENRAALIRKLEEKDESKKDGSEL